MHQRALGDEELYRVCVGDDDSTDYYLERFQRFDSGDGNASWSWPAFWATFLWLVHRRMFGYAAAYAIVLPLLLLGFAWVMTQVLGESAGRFFESSAAFVTLWVMVPMFANAAYHQHVNARIEKAAAGAASREEILETLSRQRPTLHPAIVVVALGVLALGAVAAFFAFDTYGSRTIRKQVASSIELAAPVQAAVERAHANSGEWPADLAAAGLAGVDHQGQYVTAIDVIDGMVLIYYGNEADVTIARSALSLRPALVDGKIVWKCGYARSTELDSVYGTNIDAKYLPGECQATSP